MRETGIWSRDSFGGQDRRRRSATWRAMTYGSDEDTTNCDLETEAGGGAGATGFTMQA